MKAFRSSVVAVFALALTAASAIAETNPAYEAWAKHKPGSMVVHKSTADMGGNKMESEMTTTLVEVTPEKVVVEMKNVMVMMGNKIDSPPMKMDITKAMPTAPGQPADAPKPEVKTSEETVTVGGKEYKCTVYETKMDSGGAVGVTKAWMSMDVPGGMVKSVMTMEKPMAGVTTVELVKFESK
jgi:hypothetical protein